MKKISTLAFASLFITSVACAQAPVFTTLNTSGKDIFAGVKLEAKGMEPETYLLQVTKDMSSNKIALPTELSHREVVALFPAEKNQLVVMSQRTVEQGDSPQFHSYNPAKKEWKKLAQVDCMTFSKLKVEKSSVTVSCLETNAKGQEVESQKKVALKGITLTQPGDVILPMAKVEKDSIRAELIGDSFEWKELKVGHDKKEKTFRP
ncbi:MAG: hypothetical protein NDI69_15150 [Bacteriovoracaceae bacterium]|nr:hypothetical protein [Bacteriovoracaceae bacterium]